MTGNHEDQQYLQVAVITDGRSVALQQPVRHRLSFLGHSTTALQLPAAGESAKENVCPEVEEIFRAGAVGVLISSSGSGLGMNLNKCPGIQVATCFDEQMAIEAAHLPGVNGCEIFAGLQVDEILKIAVAFLDNVRPADE